MQQNKFTTNFEKKTTEELERIVRDRDSYVAEAREAALDILAGRELSDDSYEALKENFEKDQITETQIRKVSEVQKSIRKGKQFLTNDITAPQMHSKRVIFVFCAVFSTIFGTVLLLFNMKQVKSKEGFKYTLLFGILYTLLTIVLSTVIDFARLPFFMNLLGSLILTEYMWNKFIGEETQYRKRSWIKPLVISILISIPFVIAIIYGG